MPHLTMRYNNKEESSSHNHVVNSSSSCIKPNRKVSLICTTIIVTSLYFPLQWEETSVVAAFEAHFDVKKAFIQLVKILYHNIICNFSVHHIIESNIPY